MKLRKFLLTPPVVAISVALFCGALFAEEPNTFLGAVDNDWSKDDNWSQGHVPQADEDVVIDGMTVEAQGALDVGSLTLKGAAKLTVKAVGLSDEELAVFSTLETDLAPIAAKLWDKATIVKIRNNFTVKGGATVIPDADKVTGVPVIFKVGGNFELGEGSSFNAVNRGWGWTLGSTDLAGAKTNPGGTAAWTFAPGAGHAYNFGGGYGGNASCPQENGGRRYGYAYGCSFAPFLPGSCSGVYTQTSAATIDGTRGGGAIVIFTEGRATVDGTMTAMSERHDYSSASGGSIWLTAASFTFGSSARLTAKAADSQNYQWNGVGGGGRIALAEGYAWADIETAADGALPTGFIEQPTIWPEIVPADVSKAACNDAKKNYEPNPGTLSFVRKADLPVQMRVTIDGAGSVTYDGTTYDESFVVDVPVNEALTLTAAAADGSVFSAWYGDGLAADGVVEPEISSTANIPFKLRVVFKSFAATTRAWTGAVSDDWNTGANWEPAGVPGPNDSVTVGGASLKLVRTADIAALTLADGAALTVGAVSISLGGADMRNDATLNIAGDLTISGGSKLVVYAGTLSDLSVFETLETDLAPIASAIWNAAKIVTVGGDLVVEGSGSTVSPDADRTTGVPVIFKVGGDFTLGEGASFDAAERGWGWNLTDAPAPAGAKLDRGGAGDRAKAWTFAPGCGHSYQYGAGYGGDSADAKPDGGCSYGKAYGSAFAPFLPGSCSGWYSQDMTIGLENTRGGGAVVVFAAGNATIDGTVNVSSVYHDHSGASGGGIWLAAAKFAFGEMAFLSARGANTVSYSGEGLGGGGRIALAEGYTWEDFVVAAGGSVPEDFRDAGTILASEVATDVSGGTFTGSNQKYYSNPGTLSFVRSAALPVKLIFKIVGEGSVTYDGVTHAESFEVTVPTKTDLTFLASPAEGWRFVSWGGASVPGLVFTSPELVFAVREPAEITVAFANGTVTRRWVGGREGDWASPLSWEPAGQPTLDDDVVITNGLVWTTGGATAGSLTLAGTAVMSNAAAAVEGPCDPGSLHAGATVIRVAGALRLEDSTKIIPANDPVTGAAVRYEVGSLFLGEHATIDATRTGWSWFAGTDDERHVDVDGNYQTLALGRGHSYNQGAGHGADGGASVAPYGRSYGFAYAPFLPGSPNGLHNQKISNMGLPGGTVWVRCAGLAEIEGTISADGVLTLFGSPSGGSVWIAAKGVRAGARASISAVGGELTGSYTSYGAGGRVSLALGCTDDQLDALAAGEDPGGLQYADAIDLIPVDVSGGFRKTADGVLHGTPGTATTVTGPYAYQQVWVLSDGPLAVGVSPAYGVGSFEGGTTQTFTAPEYGVDAANPAVRYACTGHVVSNTLGEVTRGPGLSVDVTVENGPMTVTWCWGSAQKRALIRRPEHATLTVDGTAADGDAAIWAIGQTSVIAAVPDEGYEFVCWEGNVPFGRAAENPLRVVVEKPMDIVPVVRPAAEPTTRTWNGTGVWTDAAKWSPAGNIPGPGDTVVIASGTCAVSNRLAAAALTVASGATLKVGAAGEVNGELAVSGDAALDGGKAYFGYDRTMPGHVRLSVGGDLTLNGAAELHVYGGPVEGGFTFASGCSFVEVGGDLALNGTSVLAPYSDYLTGGSVKMTVGRLLVAAGAKVDASEKGFMWLDLTTPPTPPAAPGIGFTFTAGATHGGKGAQSKTEPYGFELSPVMPGSPNGCHNDAYVNCKRAGGLVRIHAREMSIEGAITANGSTTVNFGGDSGGGIWLTADAFSFGADSVLSAKGGFSNYTYSYGGGGRIALGCKMSDEQLAALAESGSWRTYRPRKRKDEAAFRELFGNETMSINVLWGGPTAEELEARLQQAVATKKQREREYQEAKEAYEEPGISEQEKAARKAVMDAAQKALTVAESDVNGWNAALQAEPLGRGSFWYVDGTIPGLMLLVK